MNNKIKLVIVFILGIVISVVISTCTFIKIRSNKKISYMDKKELKSTSDPDYISGIYSSSNTLASNISTLKTSKQNVLKSVTGTSTFSSGYKTVDLGSNKNVIACSGYITSNATIPVICGVQSSRYLRFSVAYNTATASSYDFTYTYWYHE